MFLYLRFFSITINVLSKESYYALYYDMFSV